MIESNLAQGAITADDRAFTEIWENITAPQYTIIRYDIRGDLKHENISGKRQFQITSAERKITQDKIFDPVNDPFLNGAFRPVLVPPSVSATTNPNALSDEEIQRILVSSDVAWEEWLKVIDSADTLGRMITLAEGVDGVSLKRYNQLRQLHSDVRPKTRLTQKDRDAFEGIR